MRLLATTFCLLAACIGDAPSDQGDDTTDDTDEDEISPTAVYLTPVQHLTRASLALRGMRPSLEDMRAVEADKEALPAIIDRYLESPAFGETIMELHNETLLTRIEVPQFTYP